MWGDVGTVGAVLVALAAVGYPIRALFRAIQVPPAVSLMAVGVVAGPAVLNLLPASYQDHSTVLSKAAFVVLLVRAGLGLAPDVLRAVIKPALVFGLVPAGVELLAIAAFSRSLLFPGWDLALLAGFLIAAVSPAVVLPTMLNHKDAGLNGPRFVPDRILGQTVVNAFAAQSGILFLLEVIAPEADGPGPLVALARFPLALVGGIALGVMVGAALRLELILGRGPGPRPSSWGVFASVVTTLAAASAVYFGCSVFHVGVFATLAVGAMLRRRFDWCEPELRAALRQVWGLAEIVLFVNLGSRIEVSRLSDATLVFTLIGIMAVALALRLVTAAALGRRTTLEPGERRYVTLAQIPKATIQAVFGVLPLVTFQRLRPDLVPHGQTLLIMAALAILATAPIGAVILERWGHRCLGKEDAPA